MNGTISFHMNKLSFLLLLTFIAFSSSCQKDDLCTPDQQTTPRMVIVFKDANNPSEVKQVDQLQVRDIASVDFAPLDFNGSTVLTAVDTIYLPLRRLSELTSYNFVAEIEDETNVDNVIFNYSTEDAFVNRACGFVVNYNDLTGNRSDENPSNFWIRDVVAIENSINDSKTVHIEIRH